MSEALSCEDRSDPKASTGNSCKKKSDGRVLKLRAVYVEIRGKLKIRHGPGAISDFFDAAIIDSIRP